MLFYAASHESGYVVVHTDALLSYTLLNVMPCRRMLSRRTNHNVTAIVSIAVLYIVQQLYQVLVARPY